MPLVVPYVKLPQLRTFPRPTGLRQTHNAQQTATVGDRYVKTDEEFRAAIGEVAARYNDDTEIPGAIAGKVVIAASWKTSGYIIPPKCAGLTITSLPGCRLSCKDDPTLVLTTTLFEVQAKDVEISRVFCGSADGAFPFVYFCRATVGDIDGVNQSAQRIMLERCVVGTGRIYYDESLGLASEASVFRCKNITLGRNDVVFVDSYDCQVIGNDLEALSTLFSVIEVGVNGGRCRIESNGVDHGIIDTDSSGGENAVWNNTETLTMNLHATDSAGGNT
jgi:hypothetical protein